MTLLNRSARVLALVSAFAGLLCCLRPYAFADESELPTVLYQISHGGSIPTLVDPTLDFTEEQYCMFEGFLEIPSDESAEFYQLRLQALLDCRRSLDSRWYRRRAAQLIEKIDRAVETATTYYESAIQRARVDAFARFNVLVRERDLDALLQFIHEHENPEKGASLLPDNALTEMYEAYYGLRLEDAALANDDEAFNDALSEIVRTDNPRVANCAYNLVELIAVYNAHLAPQFIANATDAYKGHKDFKMNSAAYSGARRRFLQPESLAAKRDAELFAVPEGRDLQYYRNRYKEIMAIPPRRTPDGTAITAQFASQRNHAIEKVLRYVILATVDSPEGVNPKELETYKSAILGNGNYDAVLELMKLGLFSRDKDSLDRQRLALITDRVLYTALMSAQQGTPARRREIIQTFVASVENGVDVFPIYERNANFLSNGSREFAEELRAAICAAGLNSDDAAIHRQAKRLSETSPSPVARLGEQVDLRGLDVKLQAFDASQFDGKPILILFATQPNNLIAILSSTQYERLLANFQSGKFGFVGYVTTSFGQDALLAQRFGGDSGGSFLAQLRDAPYPTLFQCLAQYSNNLADTDYPLLGDFFNVKEPLFVLLTPSRKVAAVYTTNDFNTTGVWRLEQQLDNLSNSNDGK